MKTKVLNLDAKDAGEIELNDSIYGLEPRKDLLQRVVVWQLAKRRAGTHKVLTRGEINRTKKKLYKQKGTGQARHGARSAPLFVGGGKAMAPVVRRCCISRRVAGWSRPRPSLFTEIWPRSTGPAMAHSSMSRGSGSGSD